MGHGVSMSHPVTLAVDCGGTGLKAALVAPSGELLSERVRIATPYPLSPEVFVRTVSELVAPLGAYDRVSVGLPGVVRRGRVVHTPHYVTIAGPFTAELPDLVDAWSGFDVAVALEARLGRPTRAVNDAEMQGCAVVEGNGFEVVMTLGTGLGFAMFDAGVLLPKIEMSAHPFRKNESYDEQLGNHRRRELGNRRWGRRVAMAVGTLRPVFAWDRLFLGGGNTRHLDAASREELGADVTVVANIAGLQGAPQLWVKAADPARSPGRSTPPGDPGEAR